MGTLFIHGSRLGAAPFALEEEPLKILFLTQYFPPEVGAPQSRIYEFARELMHRGHNVTIITALPSYPQGEIYPEYRNKSIIVEYMDGLRVIRTHIYATKKKDFWKRIRNYTSFTLSSVFQGAKRIEGELDVVITESPPIFLGWSGYIIAKRLRASYILNISDLWPKSAVDLGVLRNKPMIWASVRLEMFCYKKADAITGQTMGIVEDISSRGFKNKTYLITNGVDSDFFNPMGDNIDFLEKNNIRGRFVAGYAGIHGIAQGLETVLKAAGKLKEYEDICFLFVGEGPEKPELMKLKESLELNNTIFLPAVPKKEMPAILSCFSCAVIPLKKIELFKGALPSKMFEALACQVPIVLSAEGEAQRLLEKSGGGICVEPENHEEMADAILRLYHSSSLRESMGKNGRSFVEKNYSRRNITSRLEKIIEEHIK